MQKTAVFKNMEMSQDTQSYNAQDPILTENTVEIVSSRLQGLIRT
jgi:hypothetical protein